MLSRFKWILSMLSLGLIVQIGYDVALTRRRSGVQIPVGPLPIGFRPIIITAESELGRLQYPVPHFFYLKLVHDLFEL